MHRLLVLKRMKLLALTISLAMLFSLHLAAPVSALHPNSEGSNCAAGDYHIHGQNHGGLGGTEGGVVDLASTPPPPEATQIVPDTAEPIRVQGVVSSAAPEHVVILVVDDFVNPRANPDLSHGNLVMEVFNTLKDQLENARDDSLALLHDVSNIEIVKVDVGLADTNPNTLESHYRARDIRAEIQNAIATHKANGTARFVVNMSFALMPCHLAIVGDLEYLMQALEAGDISEFVPPYMTRQEAQEEGMIYFDFFNFLAAHNAYPSLSIAEYIEFLFANPGATVINQGDVNTLDEQSTIFGDAALAFLLKIGDKGPIPDGFDLEDLGGFDGGGTEATTFDMPSERFAKHASLAPMTAQAGIIDPLQSLFQGYLTDSFNNPVPDIDHPLVIPVASAGNFGGIEPFVPGRWDEVVSVSANISDETTRATWSNAGEVMALGAWYAFHDDKLRAGTSYSAPAVSLAMALYLSATSQLNCNFSPDYPLLAFPGDYSNRPFAAALTAPEHCP